MTCSDKAGIPDISEWVPAVIKDANIETRTVCINHVRMQQNLIMRDY